MLRPWSETGSRLRGQLHAGFPMEPLQSLWMQRDEAAFVMDKTSLEMVEQELKRVLEPADHFGSCCNTQKRADNQNLSGIGRRFFFRR